MHRRGMMGCAGVVVCFLVLAAGISAENKQGDDQSALCSYLSSTSWLCSDYKKSVTIHLVKKDWKPILKKMPDVKDIIPKYPGSVEDVNEAFIKNENKYDSVHKPLEDALELLTGNHGYSPSKESIFLVRLASQKETKQWFTKDFVLSMAMRNMLSSYNIFTIDIHDVLISAGLTFVGQVFGVGTNYADLAKTIGTMFFDRAVKENLVKINQIHLIGFCYTATLSGYIAQYLKEQHKEKIKSVLALDPHSIGLSGYITKVLLPDDAEVIQAYHTNSIGMGTLHRRSTVDIVFNDGNSQPGCESETFGCSHTRAMKLLWYVILYPDLFLARQCSSWGEFKDGNCNGGTTIPITYPPEKTENGVFFIRTMPSKPFGLGGKGAIGSGKIEKKGTDNKNSAKDKDASSKKDDGKRKVESAKKGSSRENNADGTKGTKKTK